MAIFGGTSLGGLTGGAAVARLLVVISGNSSELQASLKGATASLAGFSQNAQTLGNSLIRGLTLPTLAIGGAAIKMASDYQAAIARVAGLTNATAQQVTYAYQHILDISKQVPTAPTELANALYFAASAGLPFAQAMQVVELSAKGAAIGMGDAADISKVLIFALNTFGKSGLTAAHAMDVLAAGIKEGTAEPEDMAIALGRLLPVAREAGVTFDEVVASVAQLTNLGVPTRVATTSLRALFSELLAPTQRANEELKALGLTADQVRTAFATGPITAFKLLESATHGNIDALHAIIPQIRGLTAYLGLTGQNAKGLADVFNRVRNSTGTLDRAFNIISQTAQFKFAIALNKMRVAGIEIGTQLFPVFLTLVSIIADVAGAFASLGPVGDSFVAALLTIGAAIGPVIKLIGVLGASDLSLLTTLKVLGTGLVTFGVSLGVAIGAINQLIHGNISLGTSLLAIGGAFLAARTGMQLLFQAAERGLLGVNQLSLALVELPGIATAAAAGVAAVAFIVASLIGESQRASKDIDSFATALEDAGSSTVVTRALITSLGKTNKTLASTFSEVAQAAKVTGSTLEQSIGPSQVEIVKRVTAAMKQLGEIGPGRVTTGFQNLAPFFSALQQAAAHGESITTAFAKAGLSVTDFINATRGMGSAGQQIANLTELSAGLTKAYRDLQDQTAAQLILNDQSAAKTQELATQYGVSTKTITDAANAQGISVVGLTDKTQTAFAQQAGIVQQADGTIANTMADLVKTYQDAATQAAQSFDIFAAAPSKLTKSTRQLVADAKRNAADLTTVARDEARLLSRGVDPALVAKIAAGGAQMTERFVHASTPQLKQLEAAYERSLQAIDAKIVLEGAHEQEKGAQNIRNFASGIRSSLPNAQGAADKILEAVAQVFLRGGKFRTGGFEAIQAFSNGIFSAKGIPQQKATAIVIDFVQALTSGKFDGAGRKNIEDYARGIAHSLHLPVSAAQTIAAGVKGALASTSTGAYSEGVSTAQAIAAGLDAGGSYAVAAAKNLAAQIRNSLHNGLTNSPKFFTYYLGGDLVKQLGEGIDASALRAKPIRGLQVDKPSGGGGGPTTNLEFNNYGPVYGMDDFNNLVDKALTEAVRRKA